MRKTKKKSTNIQSVWALGHELTKGEFKTWQAKTIWHQQRNPDWSEEFCKRWALNEILFDKSPSSHAKERLDDAHQRLLTASLAVAAFSRFPLYGCNDSLRRTGVNALADLAGDIAAISRDITSLTKEVGAEIGTDRRVLA